MITIEEKLNVFTKLILEDIQKEYEEKHQAISKENNAKIERYKISLEERKTYIVDELIRKGKNEKSKLISQANLDKKRRILNKKQEFINKILYDLQNKAVKFTDSSEYEVFLAKILSESLSNFKEERTLRIIVSQKDLEKYRYLILSEANKAGFEEKDVLLMAADEEVTGGVVIYNQDMTLKVDALIDTIIEEFKPKIGQKLYDVLKEAGDLFE